MPSTPAVSVVIPLYNAEKYISACLTSILNQTFQDFEVIVVDDCSKDISRNIAESFIPKFEGRLKLLHTEKNSGGAGVPSNIGIENARGKYVYIMDDDDLILDATLETLYISAEEFQADVVFMERGYLFESEDSKVTPDKKNLKLQAWMGTADNLVEEPELENDTELLIESFLQIEIGWPVWQKFFRRDFVTANKITFADLPTSQDWIFTLQLIYYAKRFLRVPYPLYIYRKNNANSVCSTARSNEDELIFWIKTYLEGAKVLTNFFSSQKYFAANMHYQQALLEMWEKSNYNNVMKLMSAMTPDEMYNILKNALAEKFGDNASLIAYLCTSLTAYRFKWSVEKFKNETMEKNTM